MRMVLPPALKKVLKSSRAVRCRSLFAAEARDGESGWKTPETFGSRCLGRLPSRSELTAVGIVFDRGEVVRGRQGGQRQRNVGCLSTARARADGRRSFVRPTPGLHSKVLPHSRSSPAPSAPCAQSCQDCLVCRGRLAEACLLKVFEMKEPSAHRFAPPLALMWTVVFVSCSR